MRSWLHGLLLLSSCLGAATALEVQLDEKDVNRQRCGGMYSRNSWGGSVDPYILTKFEEVKPENDDDEPVVSLVIFEWKDEPLIGVYPSPEADQKEFICDTENIANNFCNSTQIGEFIISPNATKLEKNPIITQAINLRSPPAVNYPILRTGYYCVGTYSASGDAYRAQVEFRNAYGELPAAQIAKLPFYGGLALAYALVGSLWAFFYVQHRHDILPVQNYITAIVIFLIVEMIMTWLFYDYQNRYGANVGSQVLMIVVAVLNAGRNSFSFFLLLIVCIGYGVVKPSLGKTMVYVRWLAGAHFVFGLVYSIASLTITPDSAGPFVLLVILPLAATLTAFYVWTLNSLKTTMKDLFERKQNVKASMYHKLWWCILASIVVIFAFFFFNSFTFAGVNDPDFVPFHWKTRWFILDGWLNIVYLIDVVFIAYLWRPTENNRRFAMSDELAQDDEGFEIADFGADDSGDEEEGRGADRTVPGQEGPRYDPPKAQPAPPTRDIPRESVDGETIFAVGEDQDKWSDDESARDSGEGKRLVDKDA